MSTTDAPPRDWTRAADTLVSRRAPSADEVETVERVHQLCRDWQRGLDLATVRTECAGGDRWTAARFTPPTHVMFRPLMAMLAALIATDVTDTTGMQYQTRQGTFSELDLRATGARITRTAAGLLRILWPVAYPWRRRPDPAHNDPGEAGDPVYADTAEERTRIANQTHIHHDRRSR